MSSIVLENIDKAYPGPVSAVRNLNLVINDGEFMVLLGPSGCGKTTTLRLSAGLETQDTGCVRIHGLDVTRLAPATLNVATTLPDNTLYPHATARAHWTFRLLPRDETHAYVLHRCVVAGAEADPFDSDAHEAIFEMSHGNLRAIDRIALKSLELVAKAGASAVSSGNVIAARKLLWP